MNNLPLTPPTNEATPPNNHEILRNDDSSDPDEDLLECSICLSIFEVPINHCSNGHNICSKHVKELMHRRCPFCRVPYPSDLPRNLLVERIVSRRLEKKKKEDGQKKGDKVATTLEASLSSRDNNFGPPTGLLVPDRSQNLIPGPSRSPSVAIASPPRSRSVATVPPPRQAHPPLRTSYAPSAGPAQGTRSAPIPSRRQGRGSGTAANSGGVLRCIYSHEGCPFQTRDSRSRNQHEYECDHRPVICPLRSDKCYNSVIPFSRYINHLHGYHGVKLFRELNHIHKFFVKTRDDRLVRDGASSMFIMETGPAEKFVVQVREIKNVDGEDLDIFLIWIAFHGNVGQAPDWRFRGRLCFNLSPDHDGVERSMWTNFPDLTNVFAGDVVATTRMVADQVLVRTKNYLMIPVADMRANLETAQLRNGFTSKFWSLDVTITKAEGYTLR